MSKKKRKTKITKTQRIEQQLELLYRTMKDMENKLVATGDQMFHRIYQLEQIMRGEYEEDGK